METKPLRDCPEGTWVRLPDGRMVTVVVHRGQTTRVKRDGMDFGIPGDTEVEVHGSFPRKKPRG